MSLICFDGASPHHMGIASVQRASQKNGLQMRVSLRLNRQTRRVASWLLTLAVVISGCLAPSMCKLVGPTLAYATDEVPGVADKVAPANDTKQSDGRDNVVLVAQDSTDNEPNVWIDDEDQHDIFSDETLSLWVRWNRPIEDPYRLYVNVGPWDKTPGEEGFDWADGFQEGDAYAFDQQTGELRLDGS